MGSLSVAKSGVLGWIAAMLAPAQQLLFADAFIAPRNLPSSGIQYHINQIEKTLSSRATCGLTSLRAAAKKTPEFRPIPSDLEGVPVPFVDLDQSNFIECYADSIAEVEGVEYTIGIPCDYAVALCYFRADQELVPIELNEPLMDEIFPIAESIVEDEFGDELVLQRTPQTLTLVGELEEDEFDEEEDLDMDVGDDEDDDGDEEVEVLLAFEHDNRQYNLVRMLDPMLLVGKMDEKQPQNRILLTPEESDRVMPTLEEMFLEFREDLDDVTP